MKPWNGAGDETLEPQVPEGAIKNTVTHTHRAVFNYRELGGGPGAVLVFFIFRYSSDGTGRRTDTNTDTVATLTQRDSNSIIHSVNTKHYSKYVG